MAITNPYGYKPSSNVFGGTDVSSYWNTKGDSANIPWEPATSYQSPYNFNQDFSGYWNPKGDTAGYGWDQATKWNPSKDFLSNFLGKSGLRGGPYQQEGEQSNQRPWFGGDSSGFSGGNLLPGFSVMQPESSKIVGYVPPVAGGESPWAPVAALATGLAGSFLGPIGAAAGGALGKAIFH